MFWFIIALLSVAFIALLIVPLIRRHDAVATEAGARAALDARLAAIERDREAGLLGTGEAEEARLEAKRAALADKKDEVGEKPARASRFAAFAFVGAAPLAALWIYVSIGAPGLVGVKPGEAPPMAGTMSGAAPGPMTQADVAAMAPEDRQAMIENMVSGLAARLQANPEDADGWRMLARSFVVLGRNEDAARAYRELFARAEGDAEDWRGYAGALLSLGPDEGRAEELQKAISRLQAIDPDDPMALYFLGLVAQRNGESEKAVGLWRRLLQVLPADAPVRPVIEKMIAETESAAAAEKAPGE